MTHPSRADSSGLEKPPVKILRALREASSVFICVHLWRLFLLAIGVFLAGCGDPRQPQAVWCETGTGPSQVVYPRAISYSPKDDSFFLIDRMARVQHLDHSGKFIAEWRMP